MLVSLPSRALAICGVALCLAALLARRVAPSWRVAWLLRSSHTHYAATRYDAALAAANAARELAASSLGADSEEHQRALFHTAAVHAALRQNESALAVLDECDALATRLHGAQSLRHVLLLHARAEVFEVADQMGEAVEALGRARAIRRAAFGPDHPAYARACFNQAGMAVRHANSGPVATDSWRAAIVNQAVTLAVEASEIATAGDDPEQGLDYTEALLELILSGTGGETNRLATVDG